MGNYMTKLLFHSNEDQKESNEKTIKQQITMDSSMCTPILFEKKMLCDPRSVSAGILRTPIEQLATQDSTSTLSNEKIMCDPRSISAGIARTPIETITQDNMCTPILSEKRMLCDPRSISTGISRTPIEVKCTPVTKELTKRVPSAIPEYLREPEKKKYLETNMDVVMPPLTPKKRFVSKLIDSDQESESDGTQDYLTPNVNVIKGPKSITPIDKERFIILGLDPRSPAADFDRTPILMPKSLALMKARSQEILSRKGSYESDIYNPTNSHQEIKTSFSIPKIQLLPDTTSETPKMLDIEKQDESHILCISQQSDSDSSVIECEEEVTVIKNLKYKNEKEKLLMSDEQIETKEKNKDKKDNCKDIEDNMKTMHIENDNKIEVWHDSVSSEENITGKKEKKNIIENLSQKKVPREDVIIMFDECATISTSKPIKTEENQKKGDIAERKNTKIDTTSKERKIFNPENKMHGTEMLKNRTPFGNRSNNDQVQNINSPQHLSRNKTVSIKTQQENTPPYKMYNVKIKNGHHWDPNTTVFI